VWVRRSLALEKRNGVGKRKKGKKPDKKLENHHAQVTANANWNVTRSTIFGRRRNGMIQSRKLLWWGTSIPLPLSDGCHVERAARCLKTDRGRLERRVGRSLRYRAEGNLRIGKHRDQTVREKRGLSIPTSQKPGKMWAPIKAAIKGLGASRHKLRKCWRERARTTIKGGVALSGRSLKRVMNHS